MQTGQYRVRFMEILSEALRYSVLDARYNVLDILNIMKKTNKPAIHF